MECLQLMESEQILILFHSFLGDRGFVDLSEDEYKLLGWQNCNPEVARTPSEFEDLIVLRENEHSKYYHENSLAFQEKLRKHHNNQLIII